VLSLPFINNKIVYVDNVDIVVYVDNVVNVVLVYVVNINKLHKTLNLKLYKWENITYWKKIINISFHLEDGY